jgi:hypothetical protein
MKTFKQWLVEGRAFEYQGSRYSSFGKYYKRDGESISKEEYQRASEAYKSEGVKKPVTPKKPVKPTKPKKSTPTHKSETMNRILKTPYRECKTMKEIESFVEEFSGLNCKLKGITNNPLMNKMTKVLYNVLSKYPMVGDSHFLNNFVTQEGIKEQAEKNTSDIFISAEYKEYLKGELSNVKERYGYAKKGDWLTKSLQMLGWKHQRIQKFCDENGIVYSPWAKVDDRTEKLLDEAYFEAKIEADKKSTTKSQVPNFGKVKNCYAFYSTCENSSRKWAGIYLTKSIAKKGEDIAYQQKVDNGSFPKGTSQASVVAHEFGHALDAMLELNKNSEIKAIYDDLIKTGKMWKEVSLYASYGGIEEFIAECLSEYTTSENPREACTKVGKIIDKCYQDYERLK